MTRRGDGASEAPAAVGGHRFFISYARTDAALMESQVRIPMDALGLSYFYDGQLNEGPHQGMWEVLAREIAECSVFVFLMTDEWQRSRECRREFDTAVATNRDLLPVVPFDMDFAPHYQHLRRDQQISLLFRKRGRDDFRARLAATDARYREQDSDASTDVPEMPRLDSERLASAMARIATENAQIRVLGRGDRLRLEDVYQATEFQLASDKSKRYSAAEVIAGAVGPLCVIAGAPGAGKSTFLQYAQVVGSSSLSVVCRVTARSIVARQISLDAWLDTYLKMHVGVGLEAWAAARSMGLDSELVLLIDGLDEVSADTYQTLCSATLELADTVQGCRILITCRHESYDISDFPGFDELYLLPLSPTQIDAYVAGALPAEDAERVLDVIRRNERIGELVETPFMLALLCASHSEIGVEVRARAGFFRSSVNFLLRGEDWEPGRKSASTADLERRITVLKKIAMRLFMLESSGVFEYSELLQCVRIAVGGVQDPESVLQDVIRVSGLLQRDKDGFVFVHRSIWEYLVAEAALDEPIETLADRTTSRRWEEPVRLYVGLIPEIEVERAIRALWNTNPSLALRSMTERPEVPERVLRDLYVNCGQAQRLRVVGDIEHTWSRAADRKDGERALVDAARVISLVESDCEVLYRLLNMLRESASPSAKELFGTILRLDALTTRLGRLLDKDPAMAFVLVPTGEFIMGLDVAPDGAPADASERPSHPVRVGDYAAGIYLVTNGTYYLSGFPYPADRRNEYSDREMQPVNQVTWYEAKVFCWWMGGDLPTEAEWEFMARGAAADDAAFGAIDRVSDYAWHGSNSGNVTHDVGTKLPSSRGIYDVAGNLREWCDDWYDEGYYQQCADLGLVEDPRGPDTGHRKVLRGGTFDWAAWNLRPTYRNSNTPDNRNHVTGFRMVIRHSSPAFDLLTAKDV